MMLTSKDIKRADSKTKHVFNIDSTIRESCVRTKEMMPSNYQLSNSEVKMSQVEKMNQDKEYTLCVLKVDRLVESKLLLAILGL